MSENPISISNLNDFIFCPLSIYFHLIDNDDVEILEKDIYQINGSDSHKKSDSATYSTRKSVLQGASVFSTEFNLCGKIDTFDTTNGRLTERKKKIKTVYDGYVFQLYAQYYALREMGYTVNELRLYSMDDNKVYPIAKPEESPEMDRKFRITIKNLQNFSLEKYRPDNPIKCGNCIYEPLCSFSIKEGNGVCLP